MKGTAGDESKMAYAWLNNKTSAHYTAHNTYRFGNGSMAVRRVATGRYGINIGSSAGTEAAVLATGYNGREHCAIKNWGNGTTNVVCNDADGVELDSQATVLALKKGFPNASFLWNSKPDGAMSTGYSTASDDSTQSVTRLSQGRYRVKLGPEANSGGNIQVSAYQSDATCWPENWNSGNVTVRCAKGSVLSDSRFVILALKAGSSSKPALGGNSLSLEEFAPGQYGPKATIAYRMAGKERAVNLNYEIINGMAIYEGDIILGRHDDLVGAPAKRRACTGDVCSVQSPLISIEGENYLWPGGVIPYEIDSDFSSTERARIIQGFKMVHDSTNLIIKPRSGEPDYVYVKKDEGCASYVGRQGGRQKLKLEEGACATGSIAHEMLHAAGIWHEQSREDRDSYIRILRSNIKSGKGGNFDRHVSDGVDIGEYDYGSIMHYSATAFGKDGPDGNKLPTIEVLTPGVSIGQRSALSSHDIAGVNELYAEEDCIHFNPDRADVVERRGRWKIVDGSHWVFDFDRNRSEANRSLQVIKRYHMNQVCYVGRPNASMTYLLASGVSPSGTFSGEDCIAINPAASEIRKMRGKWLIVRDTPQGINQIAQFPNAGEAYKSLDIWRQYRFTKACYVGRPNPSFTYLRR